MYSPYFGCRNSSINCWIESGDGRTKHKHRRCRIFSLEALSRRLRCSSASVLPISNGRYVLYKVDFMVEEGRLSNGCRDDGDLYRYELVPFNLVYP